MRGDHRAWMESLSHVITSVAGTNGHVKTQKRPKIRYIPSHPACSVFAEVQKCKTGWKNKKKKRWKLHKTLVPTGRSKLMSQSPAPAKYCNYEVGIPDDAHPPLLHNQQRFAADPKNHKSSSCPLSHTCRLTQASQSAVCPADADWWRAALTRRMRGSSIKDGPGRPETGSYLQRNNTETTELPPSIINQEHVETLCVFMCVRVSCMDGNPDHPPALSLDFLFKIKAWGCRNSRSPFEVVKYTANCCQNRSIRWYLISAQA